MVLPEFESLAQRTYVYDANGQEIAFYELENSQPIAYEDIPQAVIDAFLVVEDKEFFTHDGINVRSLVRATLSNFASDSPQQGASTITMQVAKNDFLAGLERDGRYKLLQMHYARMLENQMSKHGHPRAATSTRCSSATTRTASRPPPRRTSARQAADLTFIESAFLAGLVRSPSGFDPINEPERSRARWLQVLDRLVDDERDHRGRGRTRSPRSSCCRRGSRPLPDRSFARTYFTEALRDYLLNKSDILGDTYQQRYNQLFRGGLRIHTTLDANLQALAEQARNELPDNAARVRRGDRVARLARPARSGRWSAGAASCPTSARSTWRCSPARPGRASSCSSSPQRSRPGAQAERPDRRAPSRARCRTRATRPSRSRSRTRSAAGSSRCRNTRLASINCAFVRLSQIVGLNRVVDTTYRMAQSPYLYRGPAGDRAPARSSRSPASRPVPTRWRRSTWRSGVQTLANEGAAPRAVLRRVHRRPRRRASLHPPRSRHPGARAQRCAGDRRDPEGTIYGGGTGRRAAFDDRRPAFGKTGTQEDNTNAWFVGGTKQLSTAVWVGDPNRYTPMRYGNIPEFVRPGTARRRAGRSLSRRDLEGIHGTGARVPAGGRLGTAGATEPSQRTPVPPRQRVRAAGGRNRAGARRSERAADAPCRRRIRTARRSRPCHRRPSPWSRRSRSATRSRPTI